MLFNCGDNLFDRIALLSRTGPRCLTLPEIHIRAGSKKGGRQQRQGLCAGVDGDARAFPITVLAWNSIIIRRYMIDFDRS